MTRPCCRSAWIVGSIRTEVVLPSELAVPHFKVSRLAQVFSAAHHPVRDPAHHLFHADARVAEQPMALLPVTEQGVRGLLALEHGRLAHQLAELRRCAPDADLLRPREVDN